MITIRMDEEDFLDLLMDRVSDWTKGEDVEYRLYQQMYDDYVYGGVFENTEMSVSEIVDNDYVNYCDVIYLDDERYEDCMLHYEDDDRDADCGYIEAVEEYYRNGDGEPEKVFLVRAY